MNHLPELIQDLGLILIIAGITTLLFKKLKQPVVLGYIVAGFLVSPNFKLLPTVADPEDIRIWAEIGVIFLLFTLGLEFSFKKLLSIGGSSSITAITEVAVMLVIGFAAGQFMGWNLMDSIFLGGILSISSTTIILRAFEELGVKNKRFAKLVFGVLIIEDIVAVVLMVLLSTIAVSRQFEGGAMLMSVLKLTFFLLLWFVAGIFFLPTFFRKVQKYLSDETMLIVSVGLCLLMVILASLAGFSPALGAFIMGSILAETAHAQRIEHVVEPVKNLFAAVFFISVGMLIDPAMLVQYALPILIIATITIVGKLFSTSLGALISGQPLKTAIYAGMSMSQIGEFSFIIATLGLTLGVTSDFLYPIAVSVSAVTTFTTPYMIKLAGPFYNWLEARLPGKIMKTLTRYSEGAQSISSANHWKSLLKAFFIHAVLTSLIILGVILLAVTYLEPSVATWVGGSWMTGKILTALFCLAVISPFLWSLVTRKFQPEAFAALWLNKRYRGPLLLLRFFRTALAVIYISIFLLSFFSFIVALVCLTLIVTIAFIFSKKIHAFYVRIENRFLYNFHDRERLEAVRNRRELAPWDAHIAQFILPKGSPATARMLEEISLREQFGVNVAMIKRGEHHTIPAPSRFEKLYPGDVLFVIGTDEQLDNFRKYIEPVDEAVTAKETDGVVLKKILLTENNFMIGKTIRESGIREMTNSLVVGIERNGKRILNPESSTVFQNGDLVWLVGDEKLITEVLANQPAL